VRHSITAIIVGTTAMAAVNANESESVFHSRIMCNTHIHMYIYVYTVVSGYGT